LVAVVGWIISILLGVFLLYVSYLKYMEDATVWTLPQQAAYESLTRPAWSACIAWIIFSCHNYRGGKSTTWGSSGSIIYIGYRSWHWLCTGKSYILFYLIKLQKGGECSFESSGYHIYYCGFEFCKRLTETKHNVWSWNHHLEFSACWSSTKQL
jgi:hypothetical protein